MDSTNHRKHLKKYWKIKKIVSVLNMYRHFLVIITKQYSVTTIYFTLYEVL
jgi:hypothetical protein